MISRSIERKNWNQVGLCYHEKSSIKCKHSSKLGFEPTFPPVTTFTFALALPLTHIANVKFFLRPPHHHHQTQNAFKYISTKGNQTINQSKNIIQQKEYCFIFLIGWLRRKRMEFLPAYLHFVGIFLISFKGNLTLFEFFGLLCSRFSTSARETLGMSVKFHINV